MLVTLGERHRGKLGVPFERLGQVQPRVYDHQLAYFCRRCHGTNRGPVGTKCRLVKLESRWATWRLWLPPSQSLSFAWQNRGGSFGTIAGALVLDVPAVSRGKVNHSKGIRVLISVILFPWMMVVSCKLAYGRRTCIGRRSAGARVRVTPQGYVRSALKPRLAGRDPDSSSPHYAILIGFCRQQRASVCYRRSSEIRMESRDDLPTFSSYK